MANLWTESDAAVEQLYDELMARTWAIHRIVDADATDVTRPDVSANLAAVALGHVSSLVNGDADEDWALERLLWPTRPRPVATDPWWLTPLGQLIWTASLERLHGLANDRTETVHQIVS